MAKKTTHFGYEDIEAADKVDRVGDVFRSVAGRYDLMNDLMSGGSHRLWKRWTLSTANIKPGQRVLDLAGGTGDLAAPLARQVGAQGQVILADINAAMLVKGRERLIDRGMVGDNLSYVQADAERLPFAANSFDCITMAFGLRNVTDQAAALRAMHHCLRPAGRLLVLEFSRPWEWLRPAYDLYSFNVLPLMGRLVAGDSASYRYLAESIRMHPDQETLKGIMEQAGFEHCGYQNLSGGIVALHRGYKL